MLSEIEDFYFDSSDGESKIYAKVWKPQNPKMLLQISHGMVEHIERYEDFALFLNEHNILVFGNDHLGHGKTVNSEEDFGYFCKQNAETNVIDDLYKLTCIMKNQYKDLPLIFLGHSMGSIFLRAYLCKYGNELDGAIIMGTATENKELIKVGIRLTQRIAKIKGWKYRSKLVDKLAFGGFNKRFGKKGGKEWLTRDNNQVLKYVNDKRCSFIFTVNAYNALFKIIDTLNDDVNLHKMPKDLHILIVSGKDDPVSKFGKSVLEVYEKFNEIGLYNVNYKLYDECRHEILNELDKEIIYNDILNWVENIYTNKFIEV